MVEVFESPVRWEKKTNKIIIDNQSIPIGGCKIVDIKEDWFKSGKYIVCNKGGEISLTPLKPKR